MIDITVGDTVEVYPEVAGDFSGLGRVERIDRRWIEVSPIWPERGGWNESFPFERNRLVKVPPLSPPRIEDCHNGKAMLGFDSGATRNRKENELQYEGFLSPLALKMFGEYMHANRHTADGSVRASDNWQKGIPDESYRDSLLRHIMDLWLIYRGWPEAARDEGDLKKALAGAFFNVQGLMHNEALREIEDAR